MKVKALLREYGLKPSKGLGQSFLHDEAIAQRTVAAADLAPSDHVLEVGPGLGILTRALAEQAGRVVAAELDGRLVEVLRQTLGELSNVEVLHGDILDMDPAGLFSAQVQYKVVANLPYYITSAVIRHILEANRRPRVMVIMVQREVAERITASPGEMSLLAVSVQFYGVPRVVARVPRGAFYPRPKVDSAVLRIDVHDRPLAWSEDPERFFRVVKAGFSQRRKQIRNSLSKGLGIAPDQVVAALRAHGLDEKRRPQTLSIAEWGEVCRAMAPLAEDQEWGPEP
jgi:16S rRNA (adenine1518-N6/adenine1519-N6)-dimethyltransferase